MFTTECPKCGRELDIAETECPHCGFSTQAVPAERPAAPPEKRTASAARLAAPAERLARAAQRAPQRSPVRRVRRAARKSSWAIQPLYLAIFAGFLVGIVGIAVYFSSAGLFGGGDKLQLENVDEGTEGTGVGSASLGDLEVTGVRTWWAQESEQFKVRVVVVNHADVATRGVNLKVHLSPRKSRASATPLASFDLRLDEELGPRESRDMEAELMSLAHPSALPRWDEMRIEIEQR